FFTIPTAYLDSSEWLPSGLFHLTERAGKLNQTCRSRVWVTSASGNPSISMIAQQDNFILQMTRDSSNDIPHGGNHILLFIKQVDDNLRRSWANKIFDALVVQPTSLPRITERSRVKSMTL